jgi:hypothetical protein
VLVQVELLAAFQLFQVRSQLEILMKWRDRRFPYRSGSRSLFASRRASRYHPPIWLIIKGLDFLTFLLKPALSYMQSREPSRSRVVTYKKHGYYLYPSLPQLSRSLKSISLTSRLDPLTKNL